jgi:DNA-3-methyladenine glycosylase II
VPVQTRESLAHALDTLAERDGAIARAVARYGYPPPRIRPRGYVTLLRTIVGQQVSVASAAAVWTRLVLALGEPILPERLLAAGPEALRACGLSRQKARYARSLSELVADGKCDLNALPADDEDAIAQLTQILGIGRWSAEIYLMFAEGRPDIWPAGDLAVREGYRLLKGQEERLAETPLRALSTDYSPHRSALALMTWHICGKQKNN